MGLCKVSMYFSGSGDRWQGLYNSHRRQYIPGIQAVYTANWVIMYYLPPSTKNLRNPLKVSTSGKNP